MRGKFFAVPLALFAWLLFGSVAEAAVKLPEKPAVAMAKRAAGTPAGKSWGMKVNGKGRVTVAASGSRAPARLLAFRSSISPRWRLVIVTMKARADQRQTFLFRKSGGWKLLWAAGRGSEAEAVCRSRQPSALVVSDLGLSTNTWGRRCRFPRKPQTLTTKMSRTELDSVVGLVEPDPDTGKPRLRPRPAEVHPESCDWRGVPGDPSSKLLGWTAKTNPRWGVVDVNCVHGSDGFGALMGPTHLLVKRKAARGRFNRAIALVIPAWSARARLCAGNRAWPVPARPRVALGFCTPFPGSIQQALG